MSIVRMREIIEVSFKEKYENFVGTLETVRNREVIEGRGLWRDLYAEGNLRFKIASPQTPGGGDTAIYGLYRYVPL